MKSNPLCYVVAPLALLLCLSFGAFSDGDQLGLSDAVERPPEAPSERTMAPELPVRADAEAEAVDLRARVAELMIVTLQGTPAPNSGDRAFLKLHRPGGVVLPSLLTPRGAAEYGLKVKALSALHGPGGSPPFLAANLQDLARHGWGPKSFFPPLPSLLALAGADSEQTTRRYGRLIAEQMQMLGLTVHLGPSLALAPTLPNAEPTMHTLGSSPKFAAEAARIIFEEFSEANIAAAPVGFPGGGNNRIGKEPAMLLTPTNVLVERDLLPYLAATNAGVPMMHVGNAWAPMMDNGNLPASLSRSVMVDLLRRVARFEGVVLAGPMDAPEISQQFDSSAAALRSLQAGADMILWNSSGERVLKTIELIARAVEEGKLHEERIDESLERVRQLKEEIGLAEREVKLAEAERIERRRYLEEVRDIERRAIAVVQNRGGVLPLNREDSTPVGITGVAGVRELRDALERPLKHVAGQEILSAKHGGRIYDFEIDRATKLLGEARTVLCVLTSDAAPVTQVRLVRALKAAGARVVVIIMGYPEALEDLAMADGIVLCYGNPESPAPAMQAVADVLLAKGPVGILEAERDILMRPGKPERFSVRDVVRVPAGKLPIAAGDAFPYGLAVSFDPERAISKVRWDFGDGERSKEWSVEKVYAEPGRYPATLTVVDELKNETVQTFHVSVEPAKQEGGRAAGQSPSESSSHEKAAPREGYEG
jgi:beta-N-acetylhexosaminidase